ncbi:MAG: 16S rRNA (uracil(1498)-N(3))-methyltransferase [Oscillospiraceae bacterium]|nr:16S rRNA (uracil(1498)-N(3))-methyltransferase [Oscillospiraceae bacterium]
MARFFVDALPLEGAEYTLTGENAEHAKVLRLKPGEAVTLCDGRGMDCPCTVEEGLRLRAGEWLPCPAEPGVRVSVWIAFPKGDKAEHVIQKAVELGAAEIVLFPSRYCVSRPEGKALGKKLERWQKIAQAAAEQSRRGIIPSVRAADSYAQALTEAAQADLPVLFYENEAQYSLHDALAELEPLPPCHSERSEESVPPAGKRTAGGTGPSAPLALRSGRQVRDISASGGRPMAAPTSISLMTGAEGGFSEEEIARAKAAGMKICTLGPRILRCETAPLAGLTAVMYALGEL